MDVNEILNWCDQMIEKYNIADEDVVALQDILNNISEEDMYGEAEFAKDEIADEE